MTTPAQGNLSELAAKPEAGFESSGLSPDEADRLAASFKPSWEFDEAPFTQASALPHAALEALEGGGVNSEVRGNLHHPDSERSHTVPPHVPPQRVETHEPENSVIIDRSITAGEMEARGQSYGNGNGNGHAPVPVSSPFAAPQMLAAAAAANRVVAPVARSRMNADESLELPASLKKSNKGLFVGLGLAALAAVLVFAVRAMTSSASDEPPTTAATATAAAPVDTSHSAFPPIPPVPPPPVATAAAPASAPVASPPSTPAIAQTPPASPPSPAYAGPPSAQQAPQPLPHAAPTHHAAPRPAPAPKAQTGGGIVRDNPF